MDIQQLKQFKILVIGDSCTDVYNYGTCARLSPEAPVPVVKLSYSEEKPGMALNVEKNLKAFGHETLILTNRENIVKERFVDQTTMQHLLRVDRGEEKELEPMFIGLLKTIGNMNFDYDCVVISDYNKGFLTHEKCEELMKELSKRKVKIFVDSKKKDLSCYSGCIIKVNKEEFEEMEVLPLNSEIIVTLGAEGARWREKEFPVESTNVFDVCGAGDTFMASFVTALMSTDSFEDSIKFANKCAGISVKKFGNYTISLEDLDDLRF